MSSSDLFVFDGYHHSSASEMASSDADHLQIYSDCLYPFPDSPIDILQAIPDDSHHQNLIDSNAPTNTTATILSSSPPSHQFQNLSLTHLQNLVVDSSDSPDGFADFSAFEVKAEDTHNHHRLCFESAINPSFFYDESDVKLMQRSFSSNSSDEKPEFLLQSQFDNNLLNTPNLRLTQEESNFSNGHVRRVCSTGDLQNVAGTQAIRRHSSSSHVAAEGSNSFMEDATNFKVGRYSAEERKERIHRYRAKRNHRNFNKTIKYACRKTLADNRPRIRGRFARNDEPIDTPKPTCSNRFEDEDEIWIDGLHEEYENGTVRGGEAFFNSFSQTQFQYYTTTTMAIDN